MTPDAAPVAPSTSLTRRTAIAALGASGLGVATTGRAEADAGGGRAAYEETGFPRRAFVAARPLRDLVGTLGLRVVTATSEGVWGDHARIIAALKTMEVRWIRTGLVTRNPGQASWINQLAANGITSDTVMGFPGQRGGSPEELVALIATKMRGSVSMMEGTNEWDYLGGDNWVAGLRGHQTRLYQAAKATAATKAIPVAGPSFAWRTGSYDKFGNAAGIMDLGNIHLYTGGFVPGFRTDALMREERKVCGSKPMIVSETGWHTLKLDGDALLHARGRGGRLCPATAPRILHPPRAQDRDLRVAG